MKPDDELFGSLLKMFRHYNRSRCKAEGRAATIRRLAAELAKHQESEFHPDWSMLESMRRSFREQVKINERYRTALADSIRRPMGVVPDSAVGLVDQDDLVVAGERLVELENEQWH